MIAGVGGAAEFLVEDPWPAVMAAESALLDRLETGLRALPHVRVHAPEGAEGRAPTTIFTVDGSSADAVAAALAERRIAVWSGDNYACELVDALGLRANGGAVRAGIVRHTHGRRRRRPAGRAARAHGVTERPSPTRASSRRRRGPSARIAAIRADASSRRRRSLSGGICSSTPRRL